MFDISDNVEKSSPFGATLIAVAIADAGICIIALNIYGIVKLVEWLL